ncbi:MAG: hypothetical protein JSV36_02270 [Anaerolineae bacterium]|nr:MAG: hypothetical protein JSV36_02270 [Anaerolineae bacterium]
MPRNPNATRCTVPGCKAWAMRGHSRCRAHRDAELGPRGAGAPPANLNALRHGAHSHPLSSADLGALARHIVDEPDDLAYWVGLALYDIQVRLDGRRGGARDPWLPLLALRRLLPQLIARVAALLLDRELDDFFAPLPPRARLAFRAAVERAAPDDPERQLLILRQIIRCRANADRAQR